MKLKLLLLAAAAPMAVADIFSTMNPGEWSEIPSSRMDAVKPNPLPPNQSGFAAVMAAWSGGAYDSKRDRLIIWGGGHLDYAGNEIYAFDVNLAKWERINEPSADVGGDTKAAVYPDGTPRARHTYNYIQYVPAIDRFCTLGGGATYPVAWGTKVTHCFDFEKRAWEAKAETFGLGMGVTAVDPVTGKVWMQSLGSSAPFMDWDPKTNVWTKHNEYLKGWFDYGFTAAVGHNKFIAIGKGKVIVWELSAPKNQPVEVAVTGETAILSSPSPGFAFDPKSGLYVAWSGGRDVYLLDIFSRKISKAPLSASNTVTPTAAENRGTYGRFQYVPSKDAFIAVNRVTENVFLFRLPTGLATSIKEKPKAPARKDAVDPALELKFKRGGLELRLPFGSLEAAGSGLRFAVLDLESRILARGQARLSEASAGSGDVLSLDEAGLGALKPGMYFFSLASGGKTLVSRPFVVPG